jgi:hypothetical protein
MPVLGGRSGVNMLNCGKENIHVENYRDSYQRGRLPRA